MRVQLRPASVVLYTPRSGVAFQRLPTAATHATFGSVGWSFTRPIDAVLSRPMCVQVSPPSVERYMPVPHEEDWRLFCSPVPAQMIFGSPAKMARSPKVLSGIFSKIGFQD